MNILFCCVISLQHFHNVLVLYSLLSWEIIFQRALSSTAIFFCEFAVIKRKSLDKCCNIFYSRIDFIFARDKNNFDDQHRVYAAIIRG